MEERNKNAIDPSGKQKSTQTTRQMPSFQMLLNLSTATNTKDSIAANPKDPTVSNSTTNLTTNSTSMKDGQFVRRVVRSLGRNAGNWDSAMRHLAMDPTHPYVAQACLLCSEYVEYTKFLQESDDCGLRVKCGCF